MEISNSILATAAALCIGIGAGTVFVLQPKPLPVAPDSAAAGQGGESVEAVVRTPPDTVELPEAPARAVSPRTRTSGDTRTPGRLPAPSANSAPAAPVPVSTVGAEAPAASDATRDAVPAPSSSSAPIAAADTAPPAPLFEELVVSADSVIGLEVETAVSSDHARVEDAVIAQVTRDVRVGSRVAIPSGAKAHGEVTFVERGGRLKDRARLGVRFTSIVLADGVRVPIETDAIVREGSSPGPGSSAKIGGGALGGAILGGILGGARGAIIGGSAGAGAGTAAALAGGRSPATLSSGTPVTVRLIKPATVTVEK